MPRKNTSNSTSNSKTNTNKHIANCIGNYTEIITHAGSLLLTELHGERPDTKYARDLTAILREISALRREAQSESGDGQLSVEFLNTEGAER